MAILTLQDGKTYREHCPACDGVHLFDRKEKGVSCPETERFYCPDCGHKAVAQLFKPISGEKEQRPAPS